MTKGARAEGPVLRSKLSVPGDVSGWVRRPRLLARLREGVERPLILISAPAGYGKTTLVTQWVRTRRTAVPWLTLDPRDDDPHRFLRHLVAAVPDVEDELRPWVDRPQGPEYLQDAFEAWIELGRRQSRSVRIVLDDYQRITNPRIHEAVALAVESRGSRLRFLITTRVDPPLPLPRWRVEDRVLEIRGEDLRFHADEISEYLDGELESELSARSREVFATRTEGWIAGLKLACLSLRETEDPAGFVEDFSGTDRHILDYLLDEVLSQLPEDVRSLLRRTSILESLCGGLVEAVTELDDGQGRLEALERTNTFLSPRDRHREWFKIHPLVGDLLRERLRRIEPELEPTLHQRASVWYESNNDPEDAAVHSLAAEDYPRAARLLTPLLDRVWSRGHVDTVSHWLDQFPEEYLTGDPVLTLHAAWSAVLRGDIALCHRRLAPLEGRTSKDPWVHAQEALLRSHLLRMEGEPEQARLAAEEALAVHAPEATTARAGARVALAMALQDEGRAHDAHRMAEEALEGARASDTPFSALIARMLIGHTHFLCGRLARAEELCRRAIEESQSVVPYDPVAAFVKLAEVHRERNELQAAAAWLERGQLIAERTGRGRIFPEIAIESARLAEALGDPTGADAALIRAEEVAYLLGSAQMRERIGSWRSRFALGRGELERAAKWSAEIDDLSELRNDPRREAAALTVVRIRLARGESGGLMEFLAESLGQAERDGRLRSRLEIEILQARVRRAEEQIDQALIPFIRSLEAAAPERYVRLFIDEGLEAEDLVRRARGRGVELEFCDLILEAFERARGEASVPTLAEPLTPRESEVLARIETGLSNREIGRALHISESTVKTHVNRLYRKLGVKSRTQAVAVARDLRLF